jgi:hypothetical protein
LHFSKIERRGWGRTRKLLEKYKDGNIREFVYVLFKRKFNWIYLGVWDVEVLECRKKRVSMLMNNSVDNSNETRDEQRASIDVTFAKRERKEEFLA